MLLNTRDVSEIPRDWLESIGFDAWCLEIPEESLIAELALDLHRVFGAESELVPGLEVALPRFRQEVPEVVEAEHRAVGLVDVGFEDVVLPAAIVLGQIIELGVLLPDALFCSVAEPSRGG